MKPLSKKALLIIPLVFISLPLFALAQQTVTINPNIPGVTPVSSSSPGAFISNFYQFALLIAGILALGAIVYGGVKYAASAGNPSAQSEGKEWILSALYGLILLAGAYIILYTINPNLVQLNLPTLAPVAPGSITLPTSTGGIGPPGLCTNLQQLAQANKEPFPAQNSPAVTALISCIHSKISFSAPTWTFDVNHPTCNYTRGFPLCEYPCSHAQNSCHYGGYTGTDGARAVDFSIIGQTAQNIVNAAIQSCGIQPYHARCEAVSGVTVPCIGGGATHVHLSTANCDAN